MGISHQWSPSGLRPVLLLIYINDLDEDILNLILKFADNTKTFSTIHSDIDAANLQSDIDKLLKWSGIWQMKFNITKCKVVHTGKQCENQRCPDTLYSNSCSCLLIDR